MGKAIREGVISEIYFPLDEDLNAISQAVSNLLNEGWEFDKLTTTTIVLRRQWEVEVGYGVSPQAKEEPIKTSGGSNEE